MSPAVHIPCSSTPHASLLMSHAFLIGLPYSLPWHDLCVNSRIFIDLYLHCSINNRGDDYRLNFGGMYVFLLFLRLAILPFSKVIIILRTWAIWKHKRSVRIFLAAMSFVSLPTGRPLSSPPAYENGNSVLSSLQLLHLL
jgi:hypothetical protein